MISNMFPYYYSLFLYLCKDLCYITHNLADNKSPNSDAYYFKDGLLLERNKLAVCSYCFQKWKASAIGNASEYTTFMYFSRTTGLKYAEIQLGNISSLQASGFNVGKMTKLLIHGWLDSGLEDFAPEVKKAYLDVEDVNVIAVDWSPMSKKFFYPLSRVAVEPVGRYVAQFLDWLITQVGVPKASIHVIGHSLGAQIAGVTGEHVQLDRITGLDPAGPLFDSDPHGRLSPSDARFVDVIHTAGGFLGYYNPCGHVDFYPNGGVIMQPGCNLTFGRCSHVRSYKLFAESISSEGFVAEACDSWAHYKRGLCHYNTTIMGDHVPLSAVGKFYLRTAGHYPYALGNNTQLNEH